MGDWKVRKDLSSIKTGITLHAENNVFYVRNLNNGNSISIPKEIFISNLFKHGYEIRNSILSKVGGLEEKENLFLDPPAFDLINRICEDNH